MKALVAIIVLTVVLGIPVLWWFKGFIKRRSQNNRVNERNNQSNLEVNIASKIEGNLSKDTAPKTYDTNF
jgi:hypothetical protein